MPTSTDSASRSRYHGRMTRSRTLPPLLIFALAGLVACASDKPAVSGIPLFNRRSVFVGDTVTVSLPADPAAGDSWKIVSFDSSLLRPQPGSGEFRNGRLTFKFTAASPGEGNLDFQRIRANRSVDEVRRFRVIVRGGL